MKLDPFGLERWLAQWDFVPDVVDIAASGVEPLTVRELLNAAGMSDSDLLDVRLDYGDTRGDERLRTRIASTYASVRSDEILVTCGAVEASFLVMTELLNPGDEVVVMTPAYEQYAGVARAVGATVVPWPLLDNGYDVDGLFSLLTPRTKMVVVNTPHNPTGVVLSEREARQLYSMVERNGSWLLVDEVSRWLEWSGSEPTVPGRDLGPMAISIGGVSKSLGLPGLRIGWVAASTDVVNRCWSRRDYVTLAPGALDGLLADVALGVRDGLLLRASMGVAWNMELIAEWVDQLDGLVSWTRPQGGAASVLRYHSGIGPSSRVVSFLAHQHGVLLAPGSVFGIEHAFRLGVGVSRSALEEGLSRLASGLSALSEKEIEAYVRG